MNRVLNIISTLLTLLMIVLLTVFNLLINNTVFNGLVILIFLCMFLNPISNLCGLKKKIIKNPIYNILLILVDTFIIYYSIGSLIIYMDYLNNPGSELINDAVNCIGNVFIPSILSIVLLLFLQLILKREKVIKIKDNSSIMLVIIIITTIIPFFSDFTDIFMVFSLTNLVFAILLILKRRSITTTSYEQGYLIIMILMSLLSNNPIGLVLSVYLFIQLDTFGLHI